MSAMRKGPAIRLESLSKHYGSGRSMVVAVANVSLDISGGTSLAVTGPSGCGKSTLVALIGGLEVPSSGTATAGRFRVSSLSDRHRVRWRRSEVGFVFQADNLLPFLTAAENVRLAAELNHARSQRPVTATAEDLLRSVGLEGLEDRFPDALSGGQRLRVAVARALVHRPSVVIADEPTGSLDASNAHALIDVLLGAQREVGATLVVVTHDLGVARRMDRMVVLRAGRLIDDTGDVSVAAAP